MEDSCEKIIEDSFLCAKFGDGDPQGQECETNKSKHLTSCRMNSTCRNFVETCVNSFDSSGIKGIDDKKAAEESNRAQCVKMFDVCARPCMYDTQIKDALDGWCTDLVALSQSVSDAGLQVDQGQEEDPCRAFVRSHYAFDDNLGSVSFKPTLATGDARYRLDEDSAVAYFCGTGDEERDKREGNGFAKKHWRECRAQNQAVRVDGCTATVMGSITLKDKDGAETTVDKTWTFVKPSLLTSAKPLLQLVGHHSSLHVEA